MRKTCFILAIIAASAAFLPGYVLGQSEVKLSSLSPNRGPVGSLVVLSGKGFTGTENTVHFGTGGRAHLSSTRGDTEISFQIPGGISPCDLCLAEIARVSYAHCYSCPKSSVKNIQAAGT
jgi:hypothetical protein